MVEEEAARRPETPIEVFASDEHRLGLKPLSRRCWAPCGRRPLALGHHRFEWLYVTAFVSPATGETFWYLCNAVSKAFFQELLLLFAREAGAGQSRFIVLVIDGAGWHTEPNLTVPDGLRIVYLPRYSPQLQPAECLWPVLDEPIANKYFESIDQLDAVIAERCRTLDASPDLFNGRTNFHWWPKPHRPN